MSGINGSHFRRSVRTAIRVLLPVGLALGLTLSSAMVAPSSFADEASLKRDLSGGGDHRVRVAAALALGKSKSAEARGALEKALADSHPLVRTAAAAGLASLGDPASIPALERAKGGERDDSAKRQMDSSISPLKAKQSTKFLVQIGKLDNKSGTNTTAVSQAFKVTARDKLGSLPGVELLSDSADMSVEAKRRQLPAIVLDGNLKTLDKAKDGGDVGFHARVEFVVRKIPDQTLKATVGGDAKALAAAASVGERELSQLQVDAVTAATQSALKGAPKAIEAAAK